MVVGIGVRSQVGDVQVQSWMGLAAGKDVVQARCKKGDYLQAPEPCESPGLCPADVQL